MSADLLSDAQKSAIADVAIASAELETEVERCIIELCRLQWPHGAVLLENSRVDKKLDIFQQLLQIEFHNSKIPDGFTFAYTNLKNLNTSRNTIIHGQWTLRCLASDSIETIRPGQGTKDIERKDIVAHRRKRGKKPQPIPARQIKKAAQLMDLNRQLLHQLFWEHFSDRVAGLSGFPASPEIPSQRLIETIRKYSQKSQ